MRTTPLPKDPLVWKMKTSRLELNLMSLLRADVAEHCKQQVDRSRLAITPTLPPTPSRVGMGMMDRNRFQTAKDLLFELDRYFSTYFVPGLVAVTNPPAVQATGTKTPVPACHCPSSADSLRNNVMRQKLWSPHSGGRLKSTV